MERYEYITAIVDCGNLSWKYKLEGATKPGGMSHDEDVETWSEKDIVDVTMGMLDIPEDQRDLIKVEYA